jgi:hypothetical protein
MTNTMVEGQMRQRRAAHASITVTFVGGPERLYRVAVSYAGTAREVDGLTYSAADYATAAQLGNALWALFNTLTIAQALDALPHIRQILKLAA